MGNPWIERWEKNQIGWHEAEGNRHLKSHWTLSGRRVLVPLCGKSVDMLWLADRGNEVVGVELSPIAAEAFFVEQSIAYQKSDDEGLNFMSADGRIRIVTGDFFDFSETGFDAVYDRAALIALPPELRPRYAKHLAGRLVESAAHLLVSLEYDAPEAKGPPFSVMGREVSELFPHLVRRAASDERHDAPPKFASASRFDEVVWTRGV